MSAHRPSARVHHLLQVVRRWTRVDLALILLALLGVAARLGQFLSGRSLWVDEALVANDLAELSWIDSLTGRSPRNQLAPPGFWIVSHVADAVSSDELMLRLFPLLAGIALLIVTVIYATRRLEHRASRLLLVAVIAFSPSLIYYSTELKQYGIEALLSMVAIVAVAERASLSRVQIVALAWVMLAFSLPSLLIVPVLGVLWLITEARSRGLTGAVRYLAPPGAAILLAWALALTWAQLAKPGIMQGFWADAFGPLPTGTAELGWWVRNIVGLSHLSLSNLGVPLHTENPAWVTTGSRLVAVALFGLVVVGALRVSATILRSDDREYRPAVNGWLAVVPAILTICAALAAASVLELYPFRGRLLMVLVPLVAVAAAHGLDVTVERRPSQRLVPGRAERAVAATAAGAVVIAVVGSAYSLTVDPYDRWDIEPAVEWIADNAEVGDDVVAYCLSDQQLQYYRSHLDETKVTIHPCLTTLDLQSVLGRAGGERMWFLHGHVLDDAAAVELIATHPSVVATLRSEGVVAVLIDPAAIDS